MPGTNGSRKGFGLIEVIILMAIAASAMYYFQSTILLGTRFQAGLTAADSIQNLASEVRLATRDFNYCPSTISATGGGSVNSVKGLPIQIAYPPPSTWVIASVGTHLPNVTIHSVSLVMVNATYNLAEIQINATRSGQAVGGSVNQIIPIYVLLRGNTITNCMSTSYFQQEPPPPVPPSPPITVEDNICLMTQPGNPAIRFNPWPPPTSTTGYCY